jgi:hypothetical protein
MLLPIELIIPRQDALQIPLEPVVEVENLRSCITTFLIHDFQSIRAYSHSLAEASAVILSL